MQIRSHSVEETQNLGRLIGRHLDKKLMISLEGDLGAGKTHLVKGIAEGMGVAEEITSPTFALVQEYLAKDAEHQKLDLFHFDLYRLSDAEELYYMGYDDYLGREAILIVEWGSNVRAALAKDRLDIHMEYTDQENERKITIEGTGPESQKIVDRLAQA